MITEVRIPNVAESISE
ncbi:dihydrolipoyllysine-residue succinyltransferase component of 2-oxoglutarate dehydrogenase complex, partial [Chlamydia psittaci 08DC60]